MKKVLPSFSEVYNLLDQEERQKEARSQSSSDLTTATFQVSHDTGQGYSKAPLNSPAGQYAGYQRKDRPYCTFFHRPGHVIDKCYKKHGYPNSMKPNQRSDKFVASVSANFAISDSSPATELVSEDLSPVQIQQLVSFLSSKLQTPSDHPTPAVHSVSASIPSSSTVCPISSNFRPSIFCSFTGIDRPYVYSSSDNIHVLNAWVINSGATKHISHQKSSFISFKSLPHTTVSLPNGVLVIIVGIGDIELGSNLILSNFLYIPQFKFNLLSVSCLTKQLHCRV